MPLRIGFDMDGVLADFASAYRDVELRLFPEEEAGRPDEPERQEQEEAKADAQAAASPRAARRRRDAIWKKSEETANFWTTLKPIDPAAVRRIHELMLRHRWEVFFLTQRPATDGETVQRQTQRWLVEQGFDLPSVLVIGGSRGAAAGALRLNYHVDDSAQNCIDVLADSQARPILIVPEEDQTTVASARKLGIGVAPGISACLDILDQATIARAHPNLLGRLAAFVGWK